MRINSFLFFVFILVTSSVHAQHLQLKETKGELGVMGGLGSYNGDLSPDIQFVNYNFGAYFKKQMNDYVGLRLNYEYLDLAANDAQSNYPYVYQRNLYFHRTFHDISVMGELYFLRFIDGNKRFRFTPYLGFGFGGLKSITWTPNLAGSKTQRTLVTPINLGFKYNVKGPWNVFTEATYRFTNSDYIDFFGDENTYTPPGVTKVYQPSTSGNDQYFTLKLGVSYNFTKVYGPDYYKAPKKGLFQKNREKNSPSSKKGLFGLFKRN